MFNLVRLLVLSRRVAAIFWGVERNEPEEPGHRHAQVWKAEARMLQATVYIEDARTHECCSRVLAGEVEERVNRTCAQPGVWIEDQDERRAGQTPATVHRPRKSLVLRV